MKTVPLHSLCENFRQDVVDGPFGSEMKRSDYTDAGFPVLKIQDIKPMEIRQKSLDFVSPAKFEYLKRHSFRRGDIVVTKLGDPLGVAAIVDHLDEGVIVADLVRIRAQKINTKYLCYHINSPQTAEFINSLQKGTTRPRVTLAAVRDLPIYAPPLPEQRRIVGLLDATFAAIATAKANTETNLRNARALFASHVHAAFNASRDGWIETTLDKLATNLDSRRIPITKSDRKPGEYPYYGASGIVDYVADYIFDDDILLISEDGANLLARSTPIAFSVSGKCWVNNHAHILKFEHMATQRFVEFYLESVPLDEYITGAAQPKLNQKAMNSIPIPIPKDVQVQAQIVEGVELFAAETQCLAALYQQKLAALDALKKSLLHQAFSGQLTGKEAAHVG